MAVRAFEFTVTESEPAVALLATVDVVNPYSLLDVVAADLGLASPSISELRPLVVLAEVQTAMTKMKPAR